MTEFEHSKIDMELEKREEYRLEICNDCDHNAHSRADGKDYCVYNTNGVFDGRPLSDMCACSVDGYCDRWNEVGWDYPEISPEADAEREAMKRGASVNDVNNFCYRVIATCKGGLVTTRDKLILTDMAKKLIKQGKEAR